MATVKCPTCSRLIEWGADFPYRPFCSERCKMIDLGQWATGAYRVPLAEEPDPGGEKDDSRS